MKAFSKLSQLVIVTIGLFFFSSGTVGSPDAIVYNDEEILAALEPDIKGVVLSMPIEKRRMQLDTFRYGIIVAEYLEVQGQNVRMNLSLEQALEKGIPQNVYERFVNEIEMFNKSVAEMKIQGIETDIPNLKESIEAFKDRIEAARKK